MKKKKKSPIPILITVAVAAFVGTFLGSETFAFGKLVIPILDLVGDMFVNALTLVVVPLVSSSIITGIAKMSSEGSFGKLGLKTLSFYLATTLIAVIIGLLFVNWIKPGSAIQVAPLDPEAQAQITDLQQNIGAREGKNLVLLIKQIIPSNVLQAFSQTQMLGLIFFSMLFGYALSTLPKQHASPVLSFFEGIFKTMIRIAEIILKVLPLGVFCLVAREFAKTGIASIQSLLLFSLSVISGLVVFMGIALPLFIKIVTKKSPWQFFQAMSPALLAAFSTSSSSASLPITMDCVEKKAGVSNRIASFVVPLGTSINMAGSALYECVAALFVAQAYGVDAPFATQFSLVLISLFASIGVAGVPSGSLVATIIVIKSIGLPVEGIGLFLAVDRLMDMARTTANVFSDSTCALLVASTEGEKVLTKRDLEKELG
jgi:proton glutamate symport protein